jgi:hypothetical protein
VVELHVVHEEGLELLEVAAIVGVKKRGVESGESFVELFLGFDAFERRDGLSAGSGG